MKNPMPRIRMIHGFNEGSLSCKRASDKALTFLDEV
jgi:hypothetical protein